MSKPTNRQELVEYALRRLGAPVLEINVADEQLDDILDDTIQHFHERHYDGVIRTYLKYEFTQEDIDRGSKYNPFVNPGISTAIQTYPGATGPTVDKYVENSNYIQLPPHIIGVEKVFTPPSATGGPLGGLIGGGGLLGPGASYYGLNGYGYLGGIGYLWGGDMITAYIAGMWRSTFDFLNNPPSIIRFNKRQDRLYLDVNWQNIAVGSIIVIDCYRALDPQQFCEIYNDSWVKKYLVSAIKKQWGQNLIKFTGTKLPGGIEMNGRQLYDDGVRELEEIKREMSSTYELPPLDFVG
ncbi:MAG: hypothetical protein CMQ57_04890 [Gammaproteobacteria bacterium]|nr:hypothetical protein [Gammaproteobacteria bacterium]|tara:strand:+ start:25257 stop:26144 length:888 start_codon:yes stop_codon:yes gene_type:complete